MTQQSRASHHQIPLLKRSRRASRKWLETTKNKAVRSAGQDGFLVAIVTAIATMVGNGSAIALGLSLFAAGLPHGFIRGAQANPRLNSAPYWFAYIAAAIAFFAGFLLAPLALLVVFLAVSLIHFAVSDALRSRAESLAVAALAVGGGALFQPSSTSEMLGLAAGETMPATVMNVLAICGAAGVLIALALVCLDPRRQWGMLAAIAIVALLQPVLAVGAIFYLYHAAPIQRRSTLNQNYDIHFAILSVAIAVGLGLWLASLHFGLPSRAGIALLAAGSIAIIFPHLLEDAFDRISAKSAKD